MSDQDSNELKKPDATAPMPDGPGGEDAGSQALSDALRSSFYIIQIIMVGLAVVFLGSGVFTVDAQHKAILLRMGKPVGTGQSALLGPGFHWAFPRPIDEVVKIPFTSIQRADSTVGWYQTVEERSRGAAVNPGQGSLDPATTTYALTADTNIIHVMATLRYRIDDPVKFNFDFADAPMFITNALNNALLMTASQFTVDDALAGQRAAFKEAVEAKVKDALEKQGLGVTVDGVDYQASPPLSLSNDFDRVTQAASQGATAVNDADVKRSTVLGNARGEKETRIKNAEAAAARMVALVAAEATNFSRLLPDYQREPQLVKRLLLAETFKRVWKNAQLKEILPNLDGRQLRLHLSPPPVPVNIATNAPGQ